MLAGTYRSVAPSSFAKRLLCTSALVVLPVIAQANPKDGQVVAGSATITQSGHKLTVTQTTPDAVINWQGFSINTGETAIFNQPGASSILLNRVIGADPSAIRGNLTSNGQVWLVNPNGIVFGKSARVDVAGLLATTVDIADPDFMGGRYRFNGLGNPGAMVTNAGHLTVRNAGLAALVAPGVENTGVIRVNLGQIQLSSTAAFTVDLYGDGLFNFTLDKQVTQAIAKPNGTSPSAAVSNTGGLISPGGHILLTANAASSVVSHAINMSGYAQAATATVSNGVITLDGGDSGTVQVNGRLDASGTGAAQSGGTVQVTGSDVDVAPTAKIDVSGDTGGGAALIGGDLHGGGSLRSAAITTIAPGASITADAGTRGNGGSVVVWSDDHTSFQGTISSKGGSGGGDGGSVEVSSHNVLTFSGSVDLRAPTGLTGSLLLDPENVTIQAGGSDTVTASTGGGQTIYTGNADDSILTVETLQNELNLASVTVATGTNGSQAGDITVASNLSWDGPVASGTTLTLSAYRNIVINNGVTISAVGEGENLVLRADNTGIGTGTVIFNGNSSVDFGSDAFANVSVYYNPTGGYASPTDFSGRIGLRSDDTLTAYMLVNNVNDLQNIQTNLNGIYALGRDIDASGTATWNGGQGFIPIGEAPDENTAPEQFVGTLDGEGHVVSGLTIHGSGGPPNWNGPVINNYVGLFADIGPSGSIRNIGLTNSNISSILNRVGALAGLNEGQISDAFATGTVSAGGAVVGGLVGENEGIITQSYANVAVIQSCGSCGFGAGGLVGYQFNGSTTLSYATGSVNAQSGASGGLIGSNYQGNISQSYATGAVSSTATSVTVGGLVGVDTGGSIDQAYAVGLVAPASGTLSGKVGGLLGGAPTSPTITNSYWDTDSTGEATSQGGVGLPTVQLKSGLPTGFDSAVWTIDGTTNSGYPFLRWQPVSAISPPLTLTILTWSVADASSTYGTLPTLGSASLIGILPTDSGLVLPTIELLRNGVPVAPSSTLGVGTYTEEVVAITGSAAGNYTLATSGDTVGTLTVNPKALTWSVANTTSVFGTLPVFGNAALSGRVGSDDVSGVVEAFDNTMLVNLSSITPIGNYSERVTALTGTAANDYVISSTGNAEGILSITAPIGFAALISQIANPRIRKSATLSRPSKAVLIQDAESTVSQNHQHSLVANDASFEDLLVTLGLNTNYAMTDSGYIFPVGYDANLNRQCVALVAALTGISDNTGSWTPGLSVVPPTAADMIEAGTPIATFSGNHYSKANEHAAVFLGYHVTNGIIDGMYLIDQYDLTQIGESNPQSGARAAEIRFYPITSSSPQYFIVHSLQ